MYSKKPEFNQMSIIKFKKYNCYLNLDSMVSEKLQSHGFSLFQLRKKCHQKILFSTNLYPKSLTNAFFCHIIPSMKIIYFVGLNIHSNIPKRINKVIVFFLH